MSFEHFCIVEIMGHQRIAGKVSEHEIGGTVFLRVDVPAVNGAESFTKFYSASAVYSITPTDEATCLAAVAAFRQTPIETWRLASTIPMLEAHDDEDADYLDDEEF